MNPIEDNHDPVGDIEQNVSHDLNPTSTTNTADNKCSSIICSSIKLCTAKIFFILSLIIMYPIFLIYFFGTLLLSGEPGMCPNWCFKSKHNPIQSNQSIYRKMEDFQETKYKILELLFMVTGWLGFLSFLWLGFTLWLPSLTRLTLFGSLLWKWSLLLVALSLGFPCIMLTVAYVVSQLFTRQYFLLESAYSLMTSVYFTFILLVWVMYFNTDQGVVGVVKKKSGGLGADDYVTWTLVSLLVGAILWVFKALILSLWKARAIYNRFKNRILMAGFQLFFLAIIFEGLWHGFLLPWWYVDNTRDIVADDKDQNNKETLISKRSSIMLSRYVSLDEIVEVVKMITKLAQVTVREYDGISEIVKRCEEHIRCDNESVEYVTEEVLQRWLNHNDAKLLLEELQLEHSCDKITYEALRKWMVDGHKNCLSLGYTLVDAFAVVSVLDTILTCCLVIVVILLWLLITELATTKVLVVIASPILAFTFVFGDTCKAFFQGVVFSFVTHPFDIGDRCIIDGVEVEIKRINILTTTCLKIGTKEKILFPNSNLATKVITNLEVELDPTDIIDVVLDSSTTKSQLLDLGKQIESFFDNDKCNLYEKSCEVIVNVSGSNMKINIHFKHKMDVQDVSHMKFLQKKKRQRSLLVLEIKQFLEDLNVKIATS